MTRFERKHRFDYFSNNRQIIGNGSGSAAFEIDNTVRSDSLENVRIGDTGSGILGVSSLERGSLVDSAGFTVYKTIDTATSVNALPFLKLTETDELRANGLDANFRSEGVGETVGLPVGLNTFVDLGQEVVKSNLEINRVRFVRDGVHYENEGNRVFLKNKDYFQLFLGKFHHGAFFDLSAGPAIIVFLTLPASLFKGQTGVNGNLSTRSKSLPVGG